MLSTLALQLVMVVVASRIAEQNYPGFCLLFACALINPLAFKCLVAGMESALQFFLLAVFVAGAKRREEDGRGVETGLLLGLIVLSRLESLAFIIPSCPR